MRRFVEGIDRGQARLFPECLEDWIDADNPVRVIDAFVEKLDLPGLSPRWRAAPEATGRPSYHPSMLLKLYVSKRPETSDSRNAIARHLTTELIPRRKAVDHPHRGSPTYCVTGRATIEKLGDVKFWEG